MQEFQRCTSYCDEDTSVTKILKKAKYFQKYLSLFLTLDYNFT